MNLNSAVSIIKDLIIFLLITTVTARARRSTDFYRGRHVCAQRQQVTQHAPVTQSYRRPVYREDLQRCAGMTPCRKYRLTYETAYRTVLRVQISAKLVPGCCPGWTKRSPRDTSCMEPVCKEPCVNGECVRPGYCLCKRGYSGYRCDTDINECLGYNKCQHQCVNTNGSYACACHEGFKLAEDKMSCTLCLTCTKEFKEIQQQLLNMTSRIEELESEKKHLQTNLTSALSQYEQAIQALHVVPPSTTTEPPPATTYEPYMENMPLDRLASLSQQISILEEKMASCMCGFDYSMG